MQDLWHYLKTQLPLSEADYLLCERHFTLVSLPPKSIFIEAGRKIDVAYFLMDGFVKGYKWFSDKELVNHLAGPGDYLASIESLTEGSVSTESFESVSSCRLYKINYESLEQLKQSGSHFTLKRILDQRFDKVVPMAS
ncbi:MAG: cyclic nucleotide-binding domain-containing protein, partial [Bacteroidota bacterium]